MGSILQQLENNEAVLLMYLAGELPEEDHAEIDSQLAMDAVLRTQLEQLRRAHEAFVAQMQDAERQDPSPMNQAVAVRNVGRMIRQWQVDRLARMPAPAWPEGRKGLKYSWWAYPTAAAAAVLLAFLAWWGNTPGGNLPAPALNQFAAGPKPTPLIDDAGNLPASALNQFAGIPVLFELEEAADDNHTLNPIEVERVTEHLQQSFDNSDQLLAEIQQGGGLLEVEQELASLSSGDADWHGLPINFQ